MRYVALLLLAPAVVLADPPPDKTGDPAADARAEVRARVEKYLAAGTSGVFYSEDRDTKDGRIVRVFAVGVSPLSAVLGDEEGAEIARERAEESAKAQFVTWLGSKVTVRKTATSEILLTTEGDGAAVKEAGKKVERRTKEFEETASSVVRGLKVAAVHQDVKNKKYVIVYRWDAKAVDGAAEVNEKLNSPDPKKPEDKKPDPKKPVIGLPDKKIVIDD